MTQLENFTFPAAAIPANIGTHLKRLREELRWKLSELAKRSGVAAGTISKIENLEVDSGVCIRGRMPRADTLLRLLATIFEGGADFELKEIVPDWPEATPGRPFGYGSLSLLRRRLLGLNLEEVAKIAEVDIATLSRFERNATPRSTLYKFSTSRNGDVMPELHSKKLAKALGFKTVEERRLTTTSGFSDTPGSRPNSEKRESAGFIFVGRLP